MNIFVKAAIITTFVFLTGVIFGLWLSEERVSQLEGEINNMNEEIQDTNLQFMISDVLENNLSCKYLEKQALLLADKATTLGREVEKYEDVKKLSDKGLMDLKKRYVSMLIQDWLMVEKIKKNCGSNYVTVLYFYQRYKCGDCANQGTVLTYLREKSDGQMMVYPIDKDTPLYLVSLLMEMYNVTTFPSIVVNGKTIHGFIDADNLTEIICNQTENITLCRS